MHVCQVGFKPLRRSTLALNGSPCPETPSEGKAFNSHLNPYCRCVSIKTKQRVSHFQCFVCAETKELTIKSFYMQRVRFNIRVCKNINHTQVAEKERRGCYEPLSFSVLGFEYYDGCRSMSCVSSQKLRLNA